MALLQRGQENAGQLADLGGMSEIDLHEMFDSAAPAMIGEPKALGNFGLHVEGQLVHRAPGQQVQMAPHGPQKILRLAE